jgi:hypothetical protein
MAASVFARSDWHGHLGGAEDPMGGVYEHAEGDRGAFVHYAQIREPVRVIRQRQVHCSPECCGGANVAWSNRECLG